MNNVRKKVFVGLSGGVDSSVSALRLKKEGYDVVGVFIKTWQPDFLPCTWKEERLDAMRIAAALDIPFLTCDAETSYKESVADYMIDEYKKGRTPNPDVMCNRYVKFGTFLTFAKAHGADYIATGHYARINKDKETGIYSLMRGVDMSKDQSYFLWTLTQEQLAYILFPIGDTEKSTVRKEAEMAGLLTSHKADSQGICFLGEVDMSEFLSHYADTKAGVVLHEDGTTIGTHNGALLYTIGQRHGFSLSEQSAHKTPYYVLSKDLTKNTITVGQTARHVTGNVITLTDCVFQIPLPNTIQAQFRYRQKPFMVMLEAQDASKVRLRVETSMIEQPSLGQSCVLYNGSLCLGGGIIEKIES